MHRRLFLPLSHLRWMSCASEVPWTRSCSTAPQSLGRTAEVSPTESATAAATSGTRPHEFASSSISWQLSPPTQTGSTFLLRAHIAEQQPEPQGAAASSTSGTQPHEFVNSNSSSWQRTVTSVSGVPGVRVVSRDELAEQGVPANAADAQIARQNMEHSIHTSLQGWIAIIMIFACLLLVVQLALFVWLVSTLVTRSHRCKGPLPTWGWVVCCLSVFNLLSSKRTRLGRCLMTCMCCFRQDAEGSRPVPLRVRIHETLTKVIMPFVCNILGLYWVSVDRNDEIPCREAAPRYYSAACVYSAFSLGLTILTLVSMIGLMTVFYAMMQAGLLRTSRAAPRGTIDKSTAVVPLSEVGEDNKTCPICMEEYVETDRIIKVSACKHCFHKQCLQRWLQVDRTCPLCRTDLAIQRPPPPARCWQGEAGEHAADAQ